MSIITSLPTKLKVVVDNDNVQLFDKDLIKVYGKDGNLIIAPLSLDMSLAPLLILPFSRISYPSEASLSDLLDVVQGYIDNQGTSLLSDKILSVVLSDNGDGTGTSDAIGDYSVTAKEFYFAPLPGKYYNIHSLQYYIQDNDVFTVNGYGAMSVLTNGYDITMVIDGVTYYINDGQKVKKNGDIMRIAAAIYTTEKTTAGAHNALVGDSDMIRRFGYIVLNGDKGDKISITLNDSFTSLVEHRFRVTGHEL